MATLGPSIGLAIASRAGLRLDPFLSCNFVVDIEGLLAGGFTNCSGLEVETEVHEYRQGGMNDHILRFAGSSKHPRLVLRHGLSPLDGLWTWHQDVVAQRIERKNGTIYLLDRRSIPVMWWNISEALPVKWSGPALDAATSAVAFEAVELIHNGLGRPQLGGQADEDIAAEFLAALNIGSNFF
jgi:phage tail-like protein